MARKPRYRGPTPGSEADKRTSEIADLVRREVERRVRPNATFEEQADAALEIMKEVLWKKEDGDLRKAVSHADEVEIDGRRYRRLRQVSGAEYSGLWGAHWIEEDLYREVGVHNGPTVKPMEVSVGMVAAHMTPPLARVVTGLFAETSSRGVERILSLVGFEAPSRSFLEKRGKAIAIELGAHTNELDAQCRTVTELPATITAVSCGMDRMAVRMSEPVDAAVAPKPQRREPYERTPPEPRQHNYRMAWAGSTTFYDQRGEALLVYRYAADAKTTAAQLAKRIAADVAWSVGQDPTRVVHCIQDGAAELRILPETLSKQLPAGTTMRELVDFEHLMGYLDKVVDACEPEGDPYHMKGWYRGELLRDDGAIDRICRNLRAQGERLPRRAAPQREAIAAALRYIRKRRQRMRYASLVQENLPIGSGATEGTCWLMQDRVKRPGQSWEQAGLRGVLGLRSYAISDRWPQVWAAFADSHRREVRAS
ncbi:MAG: hypothetical protein V2A79_14625 [Planctomycetota bacterium]